MKKVIIAVGALATVGAGSPPPPSDLRVELNGLRSARGVVHLCLTSSEQRFLKCKNDRSAVARTIPAGKAQRLELGQVRPGTYALLIVHDENENGKLDMMMGIPREGFGFSNNPSVRPRAPRWEEIRFTMPPSGLKQQVRMRYVL
jgi:uncharacterized protein (DUF2141 family)